MEEIGDRGSWIEETEDTRAVPCSGASMTVALFAAKELGMNGSRAELRLIDD